MPPSAIDIESGLIIAVEEVFVPQSAVDEQGLFQKCLSGLLHLRDFCRAGALQGANFQGVVIGGVAGGLVESFGIGGDEGQESGAKTFAVTISGEETEFLEEFATEAKRRLDLIDASSNPDVYPDSTQ